MLYNIVYMEIEKSLSLIASILDRQKAEDIVVLDIRNILDITDYFVIASGMTDLHSRACADYLRRSLKKAGIKIYAIEGEREGQWILMDLDFCMVHIFTEETRKYYSLDRLYSDAPGIEVNGYKDIQKTRS